MLCVLRRLTGPLLVLALLAGVLGALLVSVPFLSPPPPIAGQVSASPAVQARSQLMKLRLDVPDVDAAAELVAEISASVPDPHVVPPTVEVPVFAPVQAPEMLPDALVGRWQQASGLYNGAVVALETDRAAAAAAATASAEAEIAFKLASAFADAAAARLDEAEGDLAATGRRLDAARADRDVARAAVAQYAVEGFIVGSGATDPFTGVSDPFVAAFSHLSADELFARLASTEVELGESAAAVDSARTTASAAAEITTRYNEERDRLEVAWRDAAARFNAAVARLDADVAAATAAEASLAAVRADIAAYAAVSPVPLGSSLTAPVLWPAIPPGAGDAIAGVPTLALDSYLKAAARLSVDDPACGLTWWQLGGFSAIESGHGRFGGATFDAAGNVSPPIIGIPLDGTDGTALIWDTDGGVMDGDRVYDRAVGPNQFIPTTWEVWGADGNGDGVIDPHNYYDASFAAARYLCGHRGPGSMAEESSFTRATLAYNYSYSYVAAVFSAGVLIKATLEPLLV